MIKKILLLSGQLLMALLLTITTNSCILKLADQEINEVNKLYFKIRKQDKISGTITDIYTPVYFRHTGCDLQLTVNHKIKIQFYTKTTL
jgi:hypothetical protein